MSKTYFRGWLSCSLSSQFLKAFTKDAFTTSSWLLCYVFALEEFEAVTPSGSYRWRQMGCSIRIVYLVNDFIHFDHNTPESSVRQCWNIQSFESFWIRHIRQTRNLFCGSPLHLFYQLDVFLVLTACCVSSKWVPRLWKHNLGVLGPLTGITFVDRCFSKLSVWSTVSDQQTNVFLRVRPFKNVGV